MRMKNQNNMKLKLEQIALYFPYGLKAVLPETNKKGCRKIVIGTIGVLYSDCSITCYDTVNSSPDRYKPLLIPLRKFEDINSPEFQFLNCDLQNQVEINELAFNEISILSLSYKTLEICLKNHIDIFDLIPKNLAVEK
jgi:hypothetical protein